MDIPEVDEMTASLICWRTWCDGPTDGLASWRGSACWFSWMNTWEEETGDWGYDYALHELSPEMLREARDWFREKERWYFKPELVALRKKITDADEMARAIVDSGLTLRDWPGPTDLGDPVAWFRHKNNETLSPVRTKERWRLPADWDEKTARGAIETDPPAADRQGDASGAQTPADMTHCMKHGLQEFGLVCTHIAHGVDRGEMVGFYWGDDTDMGRPDAWCAECDEKLVALNGASSEEWFVDCDFKILCSKCWDESKVVCGGFRRVGTTGRGFLGRILGWLSRK
ncbi:MAG: hypothetical protein QGG42_18190 [Phycisphaerae bacterium]|jgi:hypothetical protein|nr:hypothetical protein [Phycisphaerae bacterium]